MAKILLVEDNPDIANVVGDALSMENHTVDIAVDGITGRELLKESNYDLVILDWLLPMKSGVEICSEHRQTGDTTPIMILSEKNHIEEKEEAFLSGTDDYLTKPFHIRELVVRVKALLRRPKALNDDVLRAKDIVLEPRRNRVTKRGVPVKLYPRDFALLEFLMRHPNQLFSAKKLLDCVWRSDSSASVDTVRQCLMRLRQTFSDKDGNVLIRNIHGVGYRLEK